jgi:hypothetical protein
MRDQVIMQDKTIHAYCTLLLSILEIKSDYRPPIQWILGALSLGVERPGREADHSHPSSAEVKE